ncbi:MAG TPA: DUF72 domain-containing protein [archaeon]|nr:DUF72 domain-containing protein [archaeon]
MAVEGKFFIGTSGFTYKHWRGVFYPEDLPQRKWLEHYVQHFNTVEINSSFYHLPRPSTCGNWRNRVPEDFVFAMKASRFITHIKRLKEIEEPLKNFFEVIRPLEKKLGPVLFQLPPGIKKDLLLLRDFLEKLPAGFCYAFEFRNNVWYEDDLFSLLDSAGIAFCIHDLPLRVSPCVVTGKFIYVRFHGAQQAYASSYTNEELQTWAGRLKGYSKKGLDVYAYFNNDMQGYAVENAKTLKHFLGENGSDFPADFAP